MHPKFAEKIAKHLHIMKWKHNKKQHELSKWLMDRFPNLSPADAVQIRDSLPKDFNGTR